MRRFAEAGLLVGSLALALLAAEAILRAVDLNYFPRDPRYLWDHLRSDAHGTTEAKIDLIQTWLVAHPTIGYTNAWLARERPRPVDVVVLGDSITEQAIYVEALQRELGPGVELLNAGVTGYDTVLEYRMLEHLGCGWQQKVTLLQFFANDFSHTPVTFARADGKIVMLDFGPVAGVISAIPFQDRSRLVQLAVLASVRLAPEMTEEHGHAKVVKALAGIRRLSEACGSRLVVVNFPVLSEDGFAESQSRSWRAFEAAGLAASEVVDLHNTFRGCDMAQYRRSDADYTHPNGRFAEVAAPVIGAAVAAHLRRE